jgi:hypothetical protein
MGLCVLVVALGAPAGAATMMGMDAMQYYVGTWSCMAGETGKPMDKATTTYTLDSGILREWLAVPAQRDMKTSYNATMSTMWDSKNHRYVAAWLGNDNDWSVSFAKPWTGNTEQWVDHASSTTPGHTEVVRTSQNRYDFAGYPTASSMKPSFKGYCTRS